MATKTKTESKLPQVKDLLPVLLTCRPFVGARGILPVIQHFCFLKDRLMATNGHVGILFFPDLLLPTATGPADLLTKVLSSFAEDAAVDLRLAGGKLEIRVDKYVGELPSYPVVDFPTIAVPETQTPLGEDVYESIRRLAFAASTDETRPYMRGIYFDAAGIGYSTDNLRIAWRVSAQKSLRTQFVPAYLLERVLGWGEIPTHYTASPEQFWLFFSNKCVFSVMPTGDFPASIQQVIKTHSERVKQMVGFAADNRALHAALQRLLFLLEGDLAKAVRVQLSSSILRLEAVPSEQRAGMGRMVEELSVTTAHFKTDRCVLINGDHFQQAVGRFDEFFLDDRVLLAFAEKRKFGHLIALLNSG